jgi:hypothetical protein
MSRGIDELVWRAFTDPSFRRGLLNGHRRELVEAMGLTGKEREAALAVKAESLEDFAGALCQSYAETPTMRGCSLI